MLVVVVVVMGVQMKKKKKKQTLRKRERVGGKLESINMCRETKRRPERKMNRE